MKILIITTLFPSDTNEYVTPALKQFVDHWKSLSHEVVVLKPVYNSLKKRDDDTNYKIYHIKGIRIPLIEIFFIYPLKLLRELNFKPDVIIAHMFKSFLWAHKISDHFQCPLIIGVHNSDIFFSKLPHLKSRFNHSLTKANLIVCRSASIQKHFNLIFPTFQGKTVNCPSGIPSNEIVSKNIFDTKLETMISTKKIIFVTVAKLLKLKNVDQVLSALARLPISYDWEYRIVGDGPELARLKSMTESLKIGSRVQFLGWLKKDQVEKNLNETNVFVMISAPETLGLVYLEAMSKGNFIIGAKDWGVDGIVENGKNGFLCSPRDIGELEKILKDIYQLGTTDLKQLGTNTFNTISSLTLEKTAENYLDNVKKASCNKLFCSSSRHNKF